MAIEGRGDGDGAEYLDVLLLSRRRSMCDPR